MIAVLVLLLATACARTAAPISTPDASTPDASTPDLSNGVWVVPEPRPIFDHGHIILRGFVADDGHGHSYRDLIALEVRDGRANVWDGHQVTTAMLRRDPPEIAFDDDLSIRYGLQVSSRNGEIVLGDATDPRVHRYRDFAAARAAVDDDVLAQDPARVMARLGGKLGDPSTVAGLVWTHLARPRAIHGRRVTVHGVIAECWRYSDGTLVHVAPPGAGTPYVGCHRANAECLPVGEAVTAAGVVTDEGGPLQLKWKNVPYRGEATGVDLDRCRID